MWEKVIKTICYENNQHYNTVKCYILRYYNTKKNPGESFTVKLLKQLAKAHSERINFYQLFELRNRIGVVYVFRQIIPEKRSTDTKPVITMFRKRTRNIKKSASRECEDC